MNLTQGPHRETLAVSRSQHGIEAFEAGVTASRHTAHVASGASPGGGIATARVRESEVTHRVVVAREGDITPRKTSDVAKKFAFTPRGAERDEVRVRGVGFVTGFGDAPPRP